MMMPKNNKIELDIAISPVNYWANKNAEPEDIRVSELRDDTIALVTGLVPELTVEKTENPYVFCFTATEVPEFMNVMALINHIFTQNSLGIRDSICLCTMTDIESGQKTDFLRTERENAHMFIESKVAGSRDMEELNDKYPIMEDEDIETSLMSMKLK